MKPLSELRRMAVEKARKRGVRYTWAMVQGAKPGMNHFEIYDAEHNDLIATACSAELREEIISHLTGMEYQPTRW